jgi:putative Ca2+/H+ antiporter (TMEM165/GDT1 family)
MDALLSTLISVFFAEMGDRSQILTAALAMRYSNDRSVLAGLTLATILNCTISAVAGSLVDSWVSEEPMRLFTGLAYIFAGAGMLLWRRKVDLLENWTLSAFMTSFLGLFILQFGDKSQFLIAVNAANSYLWGFALAGGIIGVMAACVPAIFLRDQMAAVAMLRPARWIAGGAMLLWGLFLAMGAFRLI